ncbi:FtsX-like permease family protein [Candidatus Beckwithbacteria bacterium]|nr:FtsX-like permease family protein [Candidatus Beckwithbacteria bacterium]
MDLIEIFNESSLTLTVNKVRTGLAMLGVIIGIGSVIALMSLGQASQKNITDQIQSLGANLLTIQPGASREGGIRGASGSRESLTLDDAKAIKSEISLISDISPVISGNSQIIAGRNNTNTQVYGVYPEYLTVNNVEIEYGSFISERQITAMSRVAVLGPDVVTDLFGEGANPVGQSIRIDSQSLKIIGVTTSKGGTGMMSQDSMIFVPLTVAQKILYGQNYLSTLSLSVVNENSMSQAQDEVEALLLKRHGISDPDSADFRIMNQEDLIDTVSSVTGTFTTLLAGIAAISLVVGGIGIMNIMLVTVTERTREIGLRKALGAKKRVVIYQFLIEAILITFIGGIIGVVIGISISLILSSVMSLPFTIAPTSILLAFGVSVLIGVVFGWYPAQKAAKLQPIEALRYE